MKQKWLWLAAVGLLSALILSLVQSPWLPSHSSNTSGFPGLGLSAQAQSPTASPSPPAPTETSPSPAVTTPAVPEVTPSPEDLPAAEKEPDPVEVPPNTYQDPAGRFEIGILSGYKVIPIGGSPVIESPDGNLAYTVVVRQRATEQNLDENALAQITIETFQRGEGFQAGDFQSAIPDGIQMVWNGKMTLGRKSTPVSGKILTRRAGKRLLMLLISATDNVVPEAFEDDAALKQAVAETVNSTMAALVDSFKPL